MPTFKKRKYFCKSRDLEIRKTNLKYVCQLREQSLGKCQIDITRHEIQNNLRIDFLKFKLKICWKPWVLLSSFDSNVVCDIILWLRILSIEYLSSSYKMKCNYAILTGQTLTPLAFPRGSWFSLFASFCKSFMLNW